MMQTATYRPSPMPSAPSTPGADPVRASVAHLLNRAHGIPCSAAAQAFAQLVQPPSRFGIALDMLLPLLSERVEVARRICAAYILYYLYAAHPIAMNPFRSAFAEVFLREREVSRAEAECGGVSENEQLVWVLWKILKGDGNDLGPYSPATLAQSPLPPKLRAAQLTIDNSLTRVDDESFAQPEGECHVGSQIRTEVFLPSSGHTPVKSGHELSHSPLPPNDNSNFEFVEQGMRLLLAACQRVLTLSEQRAVVLTLPHFTPHNVIQLHSLPSLLALNPALGHPIVAALLNGPPTSLINSFGRSDVLDVLRRLSPTLPSFDVLGRLLRDPSLIPTIERDEQFTRSNGETPTTNGAPKTTIADLIRIEVLGAFILNAIAWIDRFESQAKEGLISDDRAAKGVQNLCRFYNSLIKLGLIDPSSDVESAEMAHFALAHAQFEDANALYRVLVMGKF